MDGALCPLSNTTHLRLLKQHFDDRHSDFVLKCAKGSKDIGVCTEAVEILISRKQYGLISAYHNGIVVLDTYMRRAICARDMDLIKALRELKIKVFLTDIIATRDPAFIMDMFAAGTISFEHRDYAIVAQTCISSAMYDVYRCFLQRGFIKDEYTLQCLADSLTYLAEDEREKLVQIIIDVAAESKIQGMTAQNILDYFVKGKHFELARALLAKDPKLEVKDSYLRVLLSSPVGTQAALALPAKYDNQFDPPAYSSPHKTRCIIS